MVRVLGLLFLLSVISVPTFAAPDATPNGSRLTINLALGTSQYIDLEAAGATVALTLTNPTAKAVYTLVFQQSTANPNRRLTWPGSVYWPGGGTAPALTAVADARDTFICEYWASGYYTCDASVRASIPYTPGGTDVAVADGGTGNSGIALHAIPYGSSLNTYGEISPCASGVYVSNGSGVPSCATDVPTAVTIGSAYVYRAGGTDVPVADGGTGHSTLTANAIPFGSSTNTYGEIAPCASGVYVSSSINVPSCSTTVPGHVNAGLTSWNSTTDLTPSGTSQTVDWSLGNIQHLDMESVSGNLTVTFSNAVANSHVTLVVQTSTAHPERTLTFANAKWQAGVAPVQTAVADAVDIYDCFFLTTYKCDHGSDYK
jgi:hypothetical protein